MTSLTLLQATSWTLLGLICAVECSQRSAQQFSVIVNDKGSYTVNINDQVWLRSAPTFFTVGGKKFSSQEGLVLANVTSEQGWDTLGYFIEEHFHYQISHLGTQYRVTVKFRGYRERQLVLLGQHFSSEFEETSVGDRDAVSSGFPCFFVEDAKSINRNEELGYLAFGGIMNGDTRKAMGLWSSNSVDKIVSGLDSGPLVLFNSDAQNTVIISPFTNFMASSAQYAKQDGQMVASWGVLGLVDHIPSGFSMWTSIFYSGDGTNKALEEWGRTMRHYYGKDTSYTKSDFANNYLGYWTDNGAYYYYKTEDGKNYQDTIVGVKAYAGQESIPYQYVQYDSWWYPKGPMKGVTEWVSMMRVFPQGLKYLWDKTGWPVVAHNRFWSDKTVYAKQNGGKYDFIVEPMNNKSIPVDQSFWNDLMRESKKWGLITYEQDWLNTEFDTMSVTVSNVTLGREWLRQMGGGAWKSGITIQYCMAPCRHALTSLEIPVVTQIRVSNDYQPGNDQWKIGVSSMLAHALGLAPFKDNFWTTSIQPGNVYNLSEPFPALQAVVATLSTGPVGPSDRIGYSDPKLIMKSCNADGLLLKPSRPAMAMDKQIAMAAYQDFKGQLWSTFSDISGLRFGIILAADIANKISVIPSDVGITLVNVVFQYGDASRRTADFSDTQPLVLTKCSRSKFCLHYTTPVLHLGDKSLLLLGELDKWVPMSPQRVSSITRESDDALLTLNGAVRETMTFSYVLSNQLMTSRCTFGPSGSLVLSIRQGMCS